jgi:hypothetical protein
MIDNYHDSQHGQMSDFNPFYSHTPGYAQPSHPHKDGRYFLIPVILPPAVIVLARRPRLVFGTKGKRGFPLKSIIRGLFRTSQA